MKLVVIIPALNEAVTISEVIGRIPRDIEGVGEVQVFVVDDGSTDETAALATAAGARVLRHRHNRGGPNRQRLSQDLLVIPALA